MSISPSVFCPNGNGMELELRRRPPFLPAFDHSFHPSELHGSLRLAYSDVFSVEGEDPVSSVCTSGVRIWVYEESHES